jgi:hypothetical protein
MDSAKPGTAPTREQRLAAQLRANLRRRKQQMRARGQSSDADAEEITSALHGPAAPIDPAPDKPPLAKPRNDG